MKKLTAVEYIAQKVDTEARDTIIITLVSDFGMTLNKATNTLATYRKDNGLTSAVKSHKQEALEYLTASYDVLAWTPATAMAATLELVYKFNVADSTARDYCKAYSKVLGVAHPVHNPREAMFNWLKDNEVDDKEQMKADFKAFGKDIGRSPSNINEYWKCYEFHLFMQA